MKIVMASDHAAFDFKNELVDYVRALGHEVVDVGTHSADRCDYPVYAEKAARAVAAEEYERGIVVCGSGIGVSITCNKVDGIRAVVCTEPYSAVMSRQHNNTNILCLGGRIVGIEMAKAIVDQWLAAEFEGGRHQDRINLISEVEKANAATS